MRLGTVYFDASGNVIPDNVRVFQGPMGPAMAVDANGNYIATVYTTPQQVQQAQYAAQSAMQAAVNYGIVPGPTTVAASVASITQSMQPLPPPVIATPTIISAPTVNVQATAQEAQQVANFTAITQAMAELQANDIAQSAQSTPVTPSTQSVSSGIGILSVIGIVISLLK